MLTPDELKDKLYLSKFWKIRGKFLRFIQISSYVGKLQLTKGKGDKMKIYNFDVIGSDRFTTCLTYTRKDTLLVHFDINFVENKEKGNGYGFSSLKVVRVEIRTKTMQAEKKEIESAKQMSLLEQDDYQKSILNKPNTDF